MENGLQRVYTLHRSDPYSDIRLCFEGQCARPVPEKPSKASGNREGRKEQTSVPLQKIEEKTAMWFWASSRVSKLQVWDRMQIWKKMFLQTCWGWGEAQQEVTERWCERISCIFEGVHTLGLCISRFLSEKVYSTWERKIGIKNTPSNSPNVFWHQFKVRERKGPSRGIIQKCAPHERGLSAPKIGEGSHEETLHKERDAREAAWDLRKRFWAQKNCRLWGDPGPSTTVVTADGEVQTNEEAQVCVDDPNLFVTVQLLEDTPAVLSLGNLCEDHGYSYEWTSQKPHLTKQEKKILCKTDKLRTSCCPRVSHQFWEQFVFNIDIAQDLSSTSPAQERSNEQASGSDGLASATRVVRITLKTQKQK